MHQSVTVHAENTQFQSVNTTHYTSSNDSGFKYKDFTRLASDSEETGKEESRCLSNHIRNSQAE
jgi:hypothetical protein